MNASKARRWAKTDGAGVNMKRPAIMSVCFHIAVFAVASFGLPYWWKAPPEPTEMVMSVDIMDFADMPSAPVRDTPQEKDSNEPAPPKKPVYNTSSSVPDLLSPQEPDIADVPMPDAKAEDKAIENPPKPKNKPKNKPKPKPVVEEKKEEPKKEMEKPAFDSLLKSLVNEEDSSESEELEDRPDSEGQTAQISPVSAQLLSSMEAALNSSVKKCWNVDAGGKNAHTQIVKLEVFVNRDRTVRDVKFVEFLKYNADTHYRAAADAARRALLNRNCWPLNLPEEKYDLWKSFVYTFDPSGITR